jgi:four helix bundle protein
MGRDDDARGAGSGLPAVAPPDDPRPTPHAPAERPTPTGYADADAHAHADAHAPHAVGGVPRAGGGFPHEKLDVYRVALEMVALATAVAARIPRGHRNVADHLQRAASNTVLLLAEGANRRGAALKRQRFGESRGEAGEVAAASDVLLALGLDVGSAAAELKALANRVSAMLTRLIATLA